MSRDRAARTVAARTTDRNRRGDLLVVRHRAVDQRKLETVEAKQTLTDRRVRGRVKLAPFQVAEKLVQSVVAALPGLV